MILSTLKETQGGKHETCIVNEDTKDMLQTQHSISISISLRDFKNILEQYIILLLRPTLNKLIVVRDGGYNSYYNREKKKS